MQLKKWAEEKENGLEEVLLPGNVTKDQAQLLAWAGAVLWNPGILLADEFDAIIHEDTVRIIDDVIQK